MSVKTWNELLKEIKEYQNTLPENTEIWYRGQPDAEYTLLPSLLRYKNGGKKEKEIFDTYRRLSQKLYHSHKNEWEYLVDMQHYFIPTRLLDWSENLGIALFFAISDHIEGNDIGLYLLNPVELNNCSNKGGIPIVPEESMGMSYIDNYIKKVPYPPQYPIAIKSSCTNERVMAQRGMFTIHGDSLMDLEKLCPNVVKKIIIKNEAVPEIKEFLEIANINQFTVFPDLHGLSNYIRKILK